MRSSLRALAHVGFAIVWTASVACSIRGIADGVRPIPDTAGEEGGAADATTDTATCTADLAHDAKNCGRCGRSCSGPCNDGVCDLTTLAEGQGTVDAVATNGTFVAWSSGGRNIRICPVQGCTTPSAVVRDLDITGHLVLDDETLLYTTGRTSSHGVNGCTLPDCKDDSSLGFDLGLPTALAVDQGDTFVLETEGRRVIHCGNGKCWNEIARDSAVDGAIALGLSRVYWSVLGASGAIYTCPRSGCDSGNAIVFASGVSSARALAVDVHAVRWTSFDEGTVSSCPLDGCGQAPTLLARDQKNPLGIVSDGTRIYWANAGDGTVVACEEGGCTAPEILARGLDRPQWLALDATHVYFTTASGTIGRTPK